MFPSASLGVGIAAEHRPQLGHGIDPGKIIGNLAVSWAVGWECLAYIAPLRSEPSVCGLVASEHPTGRCRLPDEQLQP